MSEHIFKIVIIGDRMTGKSSLLRRYARGTFLVPDVDSFPPFVPEYTYEISVADDNSSEIAVLQDTVADDDHEKLRPLLYIQAKIFLICFSVNDEQTFFNVEKKWYPEIKRHQPKVPFLLVGTKTDLKPKISTREGQELSEKIKAAAYIECSSKDGMGVKEVFATTFQVHKNNLQRKRKIICTIM